MRAVFLTTSLGATVRGATSRARCARPPSNPRARRGGAREEQALRTYLGKPMAGRRSLRALRRATLAGTVSRCSAAPRCRTRASSRCSTPSSTTCLAARPPARRAIEQERRCRRARQRAAPLSALAFKIATDPYVGRADLRPRLLRRPQEGPERLQPATRTPRSDRPPLLLHANHREDVEDTCTPARSAVVGPERDQDRATPCAPRTSRSSSSVSSSPSR